MENYFFRIFQKSFREKYFSFIKFSEGKIFFAKGFSKISRKKYFFIFKMNFFVEKKKLRKKIELLFRCRILSGIHFWQLEIHRSIIWEMGTELANCTPEVQFRNHQKIPRSTNCTWRISELYFWYAIHQYGSHFAEKKV